MPASVPQHNPGDAFSLVPLVVRHVAAAIYEKAKHGSVHGVGSHPIDHAIFAWGVARRQLVRYGFLTNGSDNGPPSAIQLTKKGHLAETRHRLEENVQHARHREHGTPRREVHRREVGKHDHSWKEIVTLLAQSAMYAELAPRNARATNDAEPEAKAMMNEAAAVREEEAEDQTALSKRRIVPGNERRQRMLDAVRSYRIKHGRKASRKASTRVARYKHRVGTLRGTVLEARRLPWRAPNKKELNHERIARLIREAYSRTHARKQQTEDRLQAAHPRPIKVKEARVRPLGTPRARMTARARKARRAPRA
jgi:hypothetical protein